MSARADPVISTQVSEKKKNKEWSVRTNAMADPASSKISDKFGVTLMPALDGLKASAPLGGWVMAINNYSKKQDAAWDFIKWANSKKAQKQFVLAGGPPSRLSQLEDPELKQKFPWFDVLKTSAMQGYEDFRPRIPEAFQVIDILGNNISQALSDQKLLKKQ